MNPLQSEVRQALTSLANQTAPPDGKPLHALVQHALAHIDVDLARVKRVAPGQFVAKWHRKGGALTEETAFTLVEDANVTSQNSVGQ